MLSVHPPLAKEDETPRTYKSESFRHKSKGHQQEEETAVLTANEAEQLVQKSMNFIVKAIVSL